LKKLEAAFPQAVMVQEIVNLKPWLMTLREFALMILRK
jgi:hypothetical protein